jgi:hypothetical protein
MDPFRPQLVEKVPASVLAPYLGSRSFTKLKVSSRSGYMYDQQMSKKEMIKAMMYSIFWTLDNSHHFDKLHFAFRNPTKPSGVTVRLRNTGFGTSSELSLTISGGGDDNFATYLDGKDGIRINNRVECDYKVPMPGKRKVLETFFHWLIEKYFSKIDLKQSSKFAKFYDVMFNLSISKDDNVRKDDKQAFSKAASEYSNFLKKKSKSSPSTEHAVVKEMKCCFELLMGRYAV